MKKFGFAVIVFVSLLLTSPLPLSSSPSMEELEGTLEVIMNTRIGQKNCEPLYFINVSGKKTQFSLPARAPLLSPGQKIKISGRWEEDENTEKKRFHCRKIIPVATAPTAKKAMSASDKTEYLPDQHIILGEQKVLVVCLNSLDTKDDSPVWTEEKIDDKIFSNKHSLNAYWKACSVDNKTGESKVWLSGDILNNGNWKTLSKNWTEYGYGSDSELDWFREFETDMVDLIDPEVDFSKSKYDGIIVFRAGKKWAYDWSNLGKREINTDEGVVEVAMSFLNEYDIEISNDYSTHETGHGLFSLWHANSKTPSGKIINYGDWWDNRGWAFALLDTLHRYVLGWLGMGQIKIVSSSDEYWLDQRELESGGIKLVVIPLGYNDYGRPILLYLEYHRGLGEFDSQLSFSNKNEDVDPNNLVLLRKYERKGHYDSLVYVASDDGEDCLDLESNEFCDLDYGVCIQVLEKTEGAEFKAKVKITLTEDYSTPTPPPTPSPTPTPTPSPTPTPTPTPTPCKAENITVSPNVMKLKKKTSGETTVTVTGADGCGVEGETVYAVISAKRKKLISVSPSTDKTDENGQAAFIITAAKRTGQAKIYFQTSRLESLVTVTISRK